MEKEQIKISYNTIDFSQPSGERTVTKVIDVYHLEEEDGEELKARVKELMSQDFFKKEEGSIFTIIDILNSMFEDFDYKLSFSTYTPEWLKRGKKNDEKKRFVCIKYFNFYISIESHDVFCSSCDGDLIDDYCNSELSHIQYDFYLNDLKCVFKNEEFRKCIKDMDIISV